MSSVSRYPNSPTSTVHTLYASRAMGRPGLEIYRAFVSRLALMPGCRREASHSAKVTYLSVCLPVCCSIYLYLYLYLSIFIALALALSLSICLSNCLSMYLSIYKYVAFYLSIHPSTHLQVAYMLYTVYPYRPEHIQMQCTACMYVVMSSSY